MNSQPNEIITLILQNLDDRKLMIIRRVCCRWKNVIETRIFFKPSVPSLHVCLLTNNYYHFAKHYLNYNYDKYMVYILNHGINDVCYYKNLIKIINNKFFDNQIPNTKLLIDKNSILLYAAYRGHLEVIKYLANQGVNIHVGDDYALHWSSTRGHLEVVKYLINQGAKIHAHNDRALRLSAEKGQVEVVKYLVSCGANIHADNDKALRLSAINGHLEMVKYLVSCGANIHADDDKALRLCANKGQLEVSNYLKSLIK